MDTIPTETSGKMENKDKSVRECVLEFMSYTIAHGLGRLAATLTTPGKLFWFTSCVTTSVLFIYFTTEHWKTYLSRPVQTTLTVNYENVIIVYARWFFRSIIILQNPLYFSSMLIFLS
jgi:hypothetical protein